MKQVKKITLITSVCLLILCTLAFGVVNSIPIGQFAPSTPSKNGEGYCYFNIIHGESGQSLNGTIGLIGYSDASELLRIDSKYNNPLQVNETTYLSESVMATILSVDLPQANGREWLPCTISPICSDDPNNPTSNKIFVYFIVPTSNISDVKITDINGMSGSFNHDDLPKDQLFTMILNITLTEYYNALGTSSYVPEYNLPVLNLAENVNGFATWIYFNNSEIAGNTAQIGFKDLDGSTTMWETEVFYINALNISIVRLMPMLGNKTHSTIFTLELKSDCSETGIFQGFLPDFFDTRIIIM